MVIKTSTSNGTSSFREQHSLQNFTYRNEEVTDKRFSSNLSAVPLSPLVPRSDSELCSWPTSSNFRQKITLSQFIKNRPSWHLISLSIWLTDTWDLPPWSAFENSPRVSPASTSPADVSPQQFPGPPPCFLLQPRLSLLSSELNPISLLHCKTP